MFTLISKQIRPALLSIVLLCAGAQPARAQSEASLALSMLPVASVVVSATAVGSTASAAVGALAVVPAALSVTGAMLTVQAVEASARGTVYVLERASDGARASIALTGRAAYAVGSSVACSVIATGVVLSVAGQVLAFIPNALGQALLHNERL